MTNPHACDRVAPDDRDCVACYDPIASLQGQLRGAGVMEAYGMTPGEEVNLLGAVSNGLLAVRGSMQAFCNRMSTINDVITALGRKLQQPFKLGACARRIGKLLASVCSDGIHEMLSAMTLVFVSTRLKR